MNYVSYAQQIAIWSRRMLCLFSKKAFFDHFSQFPYNCLLFINLNMAAYWEAIFILRCVNALFLSALADKYVFQSEQKVAHEIEVFNLDLVTSKFWHIFACPASWRCPLYFIFFLYVCDWTSKEKVDFWYQKRFQTLPIAL